ncbi:MAG TPA: hypothetical protein VF604_08310, partial [Pyrinomonadaceae bacterium]
IFAVIILGLLTGGILWGVNYYQNSQNQAVANNNTNQAANNPANNNANVNTNPTPAPPTNEINVEFKTTETVAVTYGTDGKTANRNVTASAPLNIKAQQNVKLRYYRGFADKVQLTVNGQQIKPPAAPPKGAGIEFEITKDNIAQILQSGTVTLAAP